jgi:alkylhydroperoxidase family enzyme
MSIIEPIDRDVALQQGLGDVLDRCEELGVSDDLFLRILAHVPGYAEAIFDAMYQAHAQGNVDHKLKEIIRIQLARTAHDPYFANLRSKQALAVGLDEERIDAGSGDFEQDPQFSAAEKWALRYSYLMYRQPRKIDKAFYDEGKQHFTEAQIMELGGMIAVHYGMAVFMRTMQAGPMGGYDTTESGAHRSSKTVMTPE